MATLSPEAEVASSRTLIVHNRTSLLQALPIADARRIGRVAGVERVAPVSLFAGYVGNPNTTLSAMMVDAPTY
eukprot:gene23684-25199_t